jgi:hypothetical protein
MIARGGVCGLIEPGSNSGRERSLQSAGQKLKSKINSDDETLKALNNFFMKMQKIIRTLIFSTILAQALSASTPARAQTNADEIARLNLRVAQLEKQVQEISSFLEPLRGQQATIASRRQALKGKLEARFAQDREKYTPEQVLEGESLFHVISQKPGTPEASESFQTLIKKYPEMNRTGCAVLYIAQRSQGEERTKYLQECIDKYNDCVYGDGVQVGAYARFLLARDYLKTGDDKKAAALSGEIKSKYPEAVDHAGSLLLDIAVAK